MELEAESAVESEVEPRVESKEESGKARRVESDVAPEAELGMVSVVASGASLGATLKVGHLASSRGLLGYLHGLLRGVWQGALSLVGVVW